MNITRFAVDDRASRARALSQALRVARILGVWVASGLGVLAAESNSFLIPAWAFDRGNVRTFTQEYADAGPMVAYGGQSPIFVEYDLEFPATSEYAVRICFAAGDARPASLLLDGKDMGKVCRTATGSWNTSGAQWEESARLSIQAGKHTLRLQRSQDFPHVVALRFDSPVIPQDFVLNRPRARQLPKQAATPQNRPFLNEANPTALRLAIENLIGTFGPRYPRGQEFRFFRNVPGIFHWLG